MFWLSLMIYVFWMLVMMRLIFIHQLNSNVKDTGRNLEKARRWVLEMDMPYIIFGGLLWPITLIGAGVVWFVNRAILGETPIEKKARKEREREKEATKAEEAARVLKKEGWKV